MSEAPGPAILTCRFLGSHHQLPGAGLGACIFTYTQGTSEPCHPGSLGDKETTEVVDIEEQEKQPPRGEQKWGTKVQKCDGLTCWVSPEQGG